MANWQELVSRDLAEDRAARRGAGLSVAIRGALDEARASIKERRAIGTKAQMAAEEATYGAYPEIAARRAGIDIPEGGGAPTGMRETRRTVGGRTYEAPDVLDEAGIANIYTDYVMKIQAQNATNAKFPNYQPIKVPTMVDFTTQYFPEYIDQIRGSRGGGGGAATGKISVIRKSDGVRGTISPAAFDPKKYTKI